MRELILGDKRHGTGFMSMLVMSTNTRRTDHAGIMDYLITCHSGPETLRDCKPCFLFPFLVSTLELAHWRVLASSSRAARLAESDALALALRFGSLVTGYIPHQNRSPRRSATHRDDCGSCLGTCFAVHWSKWQSITRDWSDIVMHATPAPLYSCIAVPRNGVRGSNEGQRVESLGIG